MSEQVFVVHQQVPDTKVYDEDKVMLGFDRAAEAKAAYVRQYDRPGFFQSMDEYDMLTFKQMLKDRKGMKLKKSYGARGLVAIIKALMPIKIPVSRKGKTFMHTAWVSPIEASEMTG